MPGGGLRRIADESYRGELQTAHHFSSRYLHTYTLF